MTMRVAKKRRYRKGTTVAQPKPFHVFQSEGRAAVRVGDQKPFFTAEEIVIQAAPVYITSSTSGLHVRGEGVVRRLGKQTIRITAAVLLAVLLATATAAQTTEERAADVASWATVATLVALDTIDAWRTEDRRQALTHEGVRVGATYAVVFAAKLLVQRERPCAPACGHDNPRFSFFSGHTALAFSTVGGPSLAVTLPLAVSTGGLRVAAHKHWVSDVLVGSAVGLLMSRIR